MRAANGFDDSVDSDEQIRLAQAEATHNPGMIHVIGLLNSRFRHSREQGSSMAEAVERAYAAHVEICEAVIAHDAQCAPEAMERSIDDLRRRLVDQARRLVADAEERAAILTRL